MSITVNQGTSVIAEFKALTTTTDPANGADAVYGQILWSVEDPSVVALTLIPAEAPLNLRVQLDYVAAGSTNLEATDSLGGASVPTTISTVATPPQIGIVVTAEVITV